MNASGKPSWWWQRGCLALAWVPALVWADNLCPPEISTRQSAAASPPGFEVAQDRFGPHLLTLVEVYDGPVEQGASLVPQINKEGESRWFFGKASQHPGLEVACHYARTSLMLVKKLPADTGMCEVKYRSSSDGLLEGRPQIASFECQ